MSLPETLILVLYFFVLSILAIYGWHRYYLVYLYMKNKGRAPAAAARSGRPAACHHSASHLQRNVRRGPADRCRLRDGLSEGPARNPGPGRLDRRDPGYRRVGGAAACGQGLQHPLPAPGRSARLQGGRPRSRPPRGHRRVRRHFRRRLHPIARLPAEDAAALLGLARSAWCRRGGGTSTRTIRS